MLQGKAADHVRLTHQISLLPQLRPLECLYSFSGKWNCLACYCKVSYWIQYFFHFPLVYSKSTKDDNLVFLLAFLCYSISGVQVYETDKCIYPCQYYHTQHIENFHHPQSSCMSVCSHSHPTLPWKLMLCSMSIWRIFTGNPYK